MYNKLLMDQTLNIQFSQNKIYPSISNFIKNIIQFNKKYVIGKNHKLLYDRFDQGFGGKL